MIGIVNQYNIFEPKILTSYLRFCGFYNWIAKRKKKFLKNKKKIIDLTLIDISTWKFYKELKKSCNLAFFGDVRIQNIYRLWYDAEIRQKYLHQDNIECQNMQIIELMNEILGIDYFKYLSDNSLQDMDSKKVQTQIKLKKETYTDVLEILGKFKLFISSLLQNSWNGTMIADFIRKFDKIKIRDNKNLNRTFYIKDKIFIDLKDRNTVSLLHELAHASNKILSKQKHEHNTKSRTKQREWLANFVAYNCFDAINSKNLEISLENIFVSPYTPIYQNLYKHGTDDKEYNKKIISDSFSSFGHPASDPDLDYRLFRFYRFFPIDQHIFLFPKELVYQIWYDNIASKIQNSKTPHTTLTTFFIEWK